MVFTLAEMPKYKYTCLAADTKPTTSAIVVGDLAVETDTGVTYRYNGTAWVSIAGIPGAGSHYLIFKDTDNVYKAKNLRTGKIDSTHASDVGILLNAIKTNFTQGSVIEFRNDTYPGSTDFTTPVQARLQFNGNGAIINGWKLKITGTTTADARNAKIQGFKFLTANSGVVINNTAHVKIDNCFFDTCTVGISVESDAVWSEIWSITHCEFSNCQTGVRFKTPTGTGTGSYVNGIMQQCTFDAFAGTVVTPYKHIDVQSGAEISEGFIDDVRFWFNADNGIGIDKGGDMLRCSIRRVYFESFVGSPTSLVPVVERATSTSSIHFQDYPIVFGSGVFTSQYDNTVGNWYGGYSSVFKEERSITIGLSNVFGAVTTTMTRAVDPGLGVGIPSLYTVIGGNVATAAEVITVEITVKGLGGESGTVTKTYTGIAGTFPLAFDDYLTLAGIKGIYIVDHVEVRAKTSLASTTATVTSGVVKSAHGPSNFIPQSQSIQGNSGTDAFKIAVAHSVDWIWKGTAAVNDRLELRNSSNNKNALTTFFDGTIAVNDNLVLSAAGLTGARTFTYPDIVSGGEVAIIDPTYRRNGRLTIAGNAANIDGMLSAHTSPQTATAAFDTTEGQTLVYASAATSGINVGIVSPTVGVGVGRRLFGMRARIRWKIDSTTTSRLYFGFTSATALPISDTPLAVGDNGIIVGWSTTDTTYQIYHNDATTSVTKDAVTGAIAKDANFHTVEISWPAAGNITVTFDGTAQVISADLPATTANLFFNAVGQTSAATARTVTIHGLYVGAEK